MRSWQQRMHLGSNDYTVFSYATESFDTIEELYAHATSQLEAGNHLSSATARRYLNNLMYEGFREIDPELQAKGIAGLSLDTKLILYESIAQEFHPQNLQYLMALNDEMGLARDFYACEAEESTSFFSMDNIETLQNQYPNLINSLDRLLKSPTSFNIEAKSNIFQQLVDAYCIYCEIPRLNVRCKFEEDEGLQGFYSAYDKSITLNTNTDNFRRNPLGTIETLIHEARHSKQHALAQAYRNGEIKESHSSYIAARLFHASLMTAGGYISPEFNYSGYRDQPAEMDARAAGGAAAAALKRNQKYLSATPQRAMQPNLAFTF